MKRFYSWIEKIITRIFPFSNSKDGSSARKLTAFGLMVCVIYIHRRFVTKENAVDVLLIDLSAILLLLGIVTVQNLVELRMGYKSKEEPKKETT